MDLLSVISLFFLLAILVILQFVVSGFRILDLLLLHSAGMILCSKIQ